MKNQLRVYQNSRSNHGNGLIFIMDGDNIKTATSIATLGENQMKAAILFAAAPDLLEAAEYALMCATERCSGQELHIRGKRVVELLESAISKAKGEK